MIAHILLESALSLLLSAFCGNVVTLDYTMTVSGVQSCGRAAFSDTSFRIQDDRQELWCNGSERWIVDHTEKEVCVEPVDGVDASSIMKLFTLVSEDPDGKVVLRPAEELGDYLKSLTVFFDGPLLRRAEIVLEEGKKPLVLTFSSQQIKDPESESFTFDTGSLPESYVITDLR